MKLFKIGTDVPLTSLHDKNEVHVNVKAGLRTVGAAFLATAYVRNVWT